MYTIGPLGGDPASILNGNMNAVGTHNPLKDAFEAVGGEGDSTAYEVMSFGLSFAAPGGMIARASDVEHLVGMTPIVDAAMGVSQKVSALWEGLRRYRFPFERVQVVTSEGHVVSVWIKGEKGSKMQMAKVEGETGLAEGTGNARPSWRHSEIDIGYPGYREQVSFRDGVEVQHGTWTRR
jgi:hypothetical protein